MKGVRGAKFAIPPGAHGARVSWTPKFPKINKAWEKIGNILIKDSKINVLNGVHDSNASYLYFKNSSLKNFTLVSTGTWYNKSLSINFWIKWFFI